MAKRDDLENRIQNKNLLWRFRGTSGFAIDEIQNNYIYFCEPELLNDPYDCFVGLVRPKSDRATVINFLKSNNQLEGLNDDQQEAFIKALEGDKFRRLMLKVDKKVFKNFGVACFTNHFGNFLMWSHYAQNHQGFCLGFNPSVDLDYFHGEKVEYLPKDKVYKPFEYDPNDDRERNMALEKIAFTKHYLWQEEYEYRSIREEFGKQHFLPEALEFIIFGMRTEAEFINGVLSAVNENGKYKKLEIYQEVASKNEDPFYFDIKKLEY